MLQMSAIKSIKTVDLLWEQMIVNRKIHYKYEFPNHKKLEQINLNIDEQSNL